MLKNLYLDKIYLNYCTDGIYARSFDLLKTYNEKTLSWKKPFGIVVNDIEAINIDRPIDFDFAELIARNTK